MQTVTKAAYYSHVLGVTHEHPLCRLMDDEKWRALVYAANGMQSQSRNKAQPVSSCSDEQGGGKLGMPNYAFHKDN